MARTDAKTIQTDDLDGSRSVGRVGLEHSIADERRLGFNDLLAKAEIDPRDVIILRHRPTEPALNKILPALAAEQPDLFNAYQQTQSPALERAMLGVRYLASFIGREPGKALFVGLYAIGPSTAVTKQQCWKKPAYRRLLDLGMRGFEPDVQRKTLLWFDLTSTDFCADWKGKLVIGWPPPERSWWRRAHKGSFPILAIHDESALVGAMPDWQDLALTWAELAAIPQSWRAAMSQWRGIYHIIDTSDGKAYVGSASGIGQHPRSLAWIRVNRPWRQPAPARPRPPALPVQHSSAGLAQHGRRRRGAAREHMESPAQYVAAAGAEPQLVSKSFGHENAFISGPANKRLSPPCYPALRFLSHPKKRNPYIRP